MKIVLRKLIVDNFMAYPHAEFDFFNRTVVAGRNGIGKSTIATAYTYDIKDKFGTVIVEYKTGCLVKFDDFHDGGNGTMYDKDIDGTDLSGKQCLYMDKANIEKIAPETIVIYKKDRQVIALDKSTEKKAIARCNPEDKFDFNIGARLAFERLTSSEPKADNSINDTAKEVCKLYKSFVDAEFTENEAFRLLINITIGGMK